MLENYDWGRMARKNNNNGMGHAKWEHDEIMIADDRYFLCFIYFRCKSKFITAKLHTKDMTGDRDIKRDSDRERGNEQGRTN